MKGLQKMLYAIIIFLLAVCLVLACFIAITVDKERERKQQLESKVIDAELYNAELYTTNMTLSAEIKAYKEENRFLTMQNEALRGVIDKQKVEREAAKDISEEQEQQTAEETAVNVKVYANLPDLPTNFYCCEPFDKFNPASEQHKLQTECVTELETGLRVYIDGMGARYYTAALAGAYASRIGEAYAVTLNNGTQFNIICGDFKHANQITAARADDYGDNFINYDGESSINIIEFIADLGIIPKICRDAGTMGALEQFGGLYGDGGNIVEIKSLGRRWTP